MDSYVLQGGQPGRARLAVLAGVMAPTTAELLDRVGVAEGMHCLDLGCGGGDVTRELGRRVTPAGRVVGIDRDAAVLALARREAEQAGLAHLEYRQGEAAAPLGEGQFDLGYARFLLSHVPDVPGVLTAL